MKYRIFALIGCFILLGIVVGASAGGAQWAAWVYEPSTGRIQAINQAGVVTADSTLPTVIAHTLYSRDVAVSESGRYFAYTVHNPSMNVSQFFVYDTATNTTPITYSPGRIFSDSIGLGNPRQMFNNFESAVVYSYSYFEPSNGWTIVVLDIATNTVLHELTSSDAAAIAAGIDPFLTPVIQRYQGAEISFSMANLGSEGAPFYSNYIWNLVSGTVEESLAFPALFNSHYRPKGEFIMNLTDNSLPNRTSTLPVGSHTNTLQVYETATGTRYAFFTSSNEDLSPPYFVGEGAFILANFYNFDTSSNTWRILNREGAIIGDVAMRPNDFRSIQSLPDGFVYTGEDASSGVTRIGLFYVDVNRPPYIPQTIWTADAGREVYAVWAGDTSGAPLVSHDYPAWNQVGAVVNVAEGTVLGPPPVMS
ncbi:MAG: hypothetical protein D6712_16405, partial [Chloroflexi bacterium]